jgi:hypothetical protein
LEGETEGTYTGDTNINRGVLQVDGSITSNTIVNRAGTLAGTGTINANLTNNGRVSPGSAGAPGVLTVVHNYTQAEFATLMIQIAGVSPDQFSVLNVLGNANLNGFLDPVLLNGFVPTIGDSFVFLDYASSTGEFSDIKHQGFDNGMLQWSVIYEANHAILTVEQHVPDQGSTFLLLTLGLLGLVMYGDSCSADSPECCASYYWEIIADNLKKAGWSWGCVLAIDSNGPNNLDCRHTSRRRKAFRCGGIGESLDCLLQCSDGRAAPFTSFGSAPQVRRP